ncbi:hypothetical protein OAN307_c40590 [Octadecabacter antarcticus 307]|uniref:Uncharacterized protein n=1 Tax=Octadecabacter antarcticus 307 TaxID=391626 RepID=M9RBE0_9RHOB|nr:hypothetical protein OAN307_c40590 [Octadecabacter antarcticus 307]
MNEPCPLIFWNFCRRRAEAVLVFDAERTRFHTNSFGQSSGCAGNASEDHQLCLILGDAIILAPKSCPPVISSECRFVVGKDQSQLKKRRLVDALTGKFRDYMVFIGRFVASHNFPIKANTERRRFTSVNMVNVPDDIAAVTAIHEIAVQIPFQSNPRALFLTHDVVGFQRGFRRIGNPPIFNGAQPYDSRGCFQFHCGCYAADAHVGSLVVVSPEPFSCLFLCLIDGFKDVLAQPFATNGSIVALDIGVLLRFAWLDVFKPNTVFLGPCHQGPADIFCAVTPSEYR